MPNAFFQSEMDFWSQCVYRVKNGLLKPKCFSIRKRAFGASAQSGRAKKDISRARNRLLGTILFLSQKMGFGGIDRLKKEKMLFPEPKTGFRSQRVSRVRNGLLEPMRSFSQEKITFPKPEIGFWNKCVSGVTNWLLEPMHFLS